jgi:hypothetical protein
MEALGTLHDATNKVLMDLRRCLSTIQRLAAQPFDTPDAGVQVLTSIRSETYEDINQIQHEYFILLAAQWLLDEGGCPAATMWSWNPRQTGTLGEPDLQGRHNEIIVVSAEITTSAKPVGVIDARMAKILKKLSLTEGAKYYFVCTERMRRRASTKLAKAGWLIQVVLLPGYTHAL